MRRALVGTLEDLHDEEQLGGQIVYPADAVDVKGVLRETRGFAALSVNLGASLVFAGDDEGVRSLKEALPEIESGGRRYPIGMPGHSAFHTELMSKRAERARTMLADLAFGMPDLPLIDGRGVQHRPLTAAPRELQEYTLGSQLIDTYDVAASLRVGLREYAPDAVVLLGPGASISGSLAKMAAREGAPPVLTS